MKFDEFLCKENLKSDKFITRSCRILYYFLLLVFVLNFFNVFAVRHYAMNIVVIASTVLLLSPTLLMKFSHHKELNRYISATLLLIDIAILYSFLTFHVLMLFIFPISIFIIYGNKKLVYYVVGLTITAMTVSHILSCYLSVNPEEPFKDMQTILLYGLLPRLIIYIALVFAFYYQAYHNSEMLKKTFKYAEELHDSQAEIVQSFSNICESKSGQTGQHVKRVSEYVSIMADNLGITGTEKECLVTASMMHDVGKLMIPPEILEKPGRLTKEEFEEIKKHVNYGFDLLKKSPGRTMDLAKEICLEHHERWDGTGYDCKKGNDIDYYSRIVSIADVFDALVSKRSYKSEWTPEEAYDEIVSQAGRQFDPSLVKTFINCYPQFIECMNKYRD